MYCQYINILRDSFKILAYQKQIWSAPEIQGRFLGRLVMSFYFPKVFAWNLCISCLIYSENSVAHSMHNGMGERKEWYLWYSIKGLNI